MAYNNIQGYEEFPTLTELQNFVMAMTERKTNGLFVEIGAFHSEKGSNTHILERNFNWTGVAFDIKKEFVLEYNQNRKSPCLLANAVTFDYAKYFEENNFPERIDFLQVDIDPGFDEHGCVHCTSIDCLLALISVPLTRYRFSVIAFEHDAIMNPKNITVRDAAREILLGLGYVLVKRWSYEDWWVDPKAISRDIYGPHFQTIAF
jgi:hypothetical protein